MNGQILNANVVHTASSLCTADLNLEHTMAQMQRTPKCIYTVYILCDCYMCVRSLCGCEITSLEKRKNYNIVMSVERKKDEQGKNKNICPHANINHTANTHTLLHIKQASASAIFRHTVYKTKLIELMCLGFSHEKQRIEQKMCERPPSCVRVSDCRYVSMQN